MKTLLLAATLMLAGCSSYWEEADRLANAPTCDPAGGGSTGARECDGSPGERPRKLRTPEQDARIHQEYLEGEARSRAFRQQYRAANPDKAVEMDRNEQIGRAIEYERQMHSPCWAHYGAAACGGYH